MKKQLMMSSVIAVSAITLGASPFDDAKFWFNGGKPSHGSGTAVTGDFFDAAHANDPSHKNHTSGLSWGYEANRQFVTTDVTFPMSGEVRSAQVLRLKDEIHNVGGVDKVWPVSVALHNLRDNLVENGVASETFTILMRLRREGDPLNPSHKETFLNWGYDGNGGFMVSFNGTEDGSLIGGKGVNGKYIEVYYKNSSGVTHLDCKTDAGMFVPTNMWVDIGISVDHDSVQLMVVKPQAVHYPGTESWRRYAPIGFASFQCVKANRFLTGTGSSATDLKDCMFVFGTEREWHGYYAAEKDLGDGKWDRCFRGDLQQFALWNRALSKQEMLDACGEPRPQLVKVGLDNGCSDEFGGERPASGKQTIVAGDAYSEKSAVLNAGDQFSISFKGRAEEAGLPQIACFKVLSGSGKIALTVNGVSCGVETVSAGRTLKLNVPGKAMKAGDNTILIERLDAGVGPLEMDYFSLGGSWQLGVAGTADGFAAAADIEADYLLGADLNPAHCPGMFATYELTRDVTFRFHVDETVAASSTSKLTIPIQMLANAKDDGRTGAEHFVFKVNQQVKLDEPAGPSDWANGTTKTIVLQFEKGELQAGWNTLNVQFLPHDAANKYTAHTANDYYRFECGRICKGLFIVVK